MNQKSLRSYTIIPDRLYVERRADTQLRQVIEAMGRPAYVLVARQMGKTNLLLHAKRNFASLDDVFVYLDASNPFPEIRQFLRNIIDLALATNEVVEAQLAEVYEQRRAANTGFTPHREHDRELLGVLRAIKGRLVIFIDEVDALRTTSYSDQIFAYIRSVYFSGRTNSPEFERLTYVLSGVAEPTDLIKNKDISPFNIGQKIYLDDFTWEEFDRFINMANLSLSEPVRRRVYHWAAGNPRISWDVCSELENMLLAGVVPNDGHVDEIVGRMYLTNFDVPPVDHVRSVVMNDPTLRDAITSLHWGKSKSIPADVANRLYLAGIIRFNDDSKDIEIRNLILAETVSVEWLRQQEGKSASLLRHASSEFDLQHWREAAELFDAYLGSANKSEQMVYVRYCQGMCFFHMGDYKRAIQCFSAAEPVREVDGTLYFATKYWLGLSYHLDGESEVGLECFKLVQENNASCSFLYEALVNSAAIELSLDHPNFDRVIGLAKKVLEDEGRIKELYKTDFTSAHHVISAARWSLAHAYRKMGDFLLAAEHLDAGLLLKDNNYMVGLFIEKAKLQADRRSRGQVCAQCAEYIIDNELVPQPNSEITPYACSYDNCAIVLSMLAVTDLNGVGRSLLGYLNKVVTDREAFATIAGDAGMRAASEGASNAASTLLAAAFASASSVSASQNSRFYGALALLFAAPNDVAEIERKYFNQYLVPKDSVLAEWDFRVIYGVVISYLPNNVERALEVLQLAYQCIPKYLDDNTGPARETRELGKAVIDCLKVDCLLALENVEEAVSHATELAEHLKKFHGVPVPSNFSPDIVDILRRRMNFIVYSVRGGGTFRRSTAKIGRNQYVVIKKKDGVTVRGKYKNISSLLNEGGIIISVEK